MNYDVAIIGAGAAGLLAGAFLHGRNVALFEAQAAPGRKLSASGGGYANFANRNNGRQFYVCEKDFCAPALAAFPPDCIFDLLARFGLSWQERCDGRYFLKVEAKRLTQALSAQIAGQGGEIFTNSRVIAIEPLDNGFTLKTASQKFQAKMILLAGGSRAWPALGGSFYGLELAKALGHHLTPAAPALAPFLWAENELKKFAPLGGISLPVAVGFVQKNGVQAHSAIMPEFRGDMLFTHKGASGPAMLNASLYWRKGRELRLDFLPGQDFEKLLDENEKGKRSPRSLLKNFLPARLVDCLLPEALAREAIARLSRARRRELGALVNNFTFIPKSTAGLRVAEVCRGGVRTDEINPHTMESLLAPNLFLAGEILDVAGQLGGYNLTWAFASAYCAAQAILRK